MKKTYSEKGFSQNCLPLTRKAQFKDQLKLNYLLFLKIGFLLFVFAIPLIACLVGEKFVIIYYANPDITDKSGAAIYSLIFDACKVVSLVVFSIGLAGTLNLYKKCAWNEPVMFGYDFSQGVKEHSKHFIIIAIIIGLFFMLANFMLVYSSIISVDNPVMFISYILLMSFFVFLLFPVALMMMFLIVYYKNKFVSEIKDGFILAIKVYFPFIFISILGTIAFFISFLESPIVMFILYFVYFVFVLPLYILLVDLYSLDLFDKFINQNFKEYQYKGLYHKEDNAK